MRLVIVVPLGAAVVSDVVVIYVPYTVAQGGQ